MFDTTELAAVTIHEFRRGLEGLTEAEAAFRPEKADGTRMNAVAWSVQHIANHWRNVALAVAGRSLEWRGPPVDGTPPDYRAALAMLDDATLDLDWLAGAGNAAMLRTDVELGGESAGTFLARAVLHTWFHTGEINAVRQLLGHAEIAFVGTAAGRLKWCVEPARG